MFRLASFGGATLGALLGSLGCSEENTNGSQQGVTGDVNKIVYAVRQHTQLDPDTGEVTKIDVAGGMGQVMDYGRFVPGGRLELLDLRTHSVENIIEDFKEADVSSVDLSFDATRVLFTMKRDGADSYHLYWSPLERGPDGKFAVTQITFGPQDDQQAIFAAGDRVVFTTNQGYTEMGTRADEYNHARVVTQLATATVDGGDAARKLCSQNLSHIVTLFSMQSGTIGFARWEHLENVNDVKLFTMNPDCSQIVAVSGQHGKPGNSVVQATESSTPNVLYAIVTNRENTIQAGTLVKLDARSDTQPGQFDEEKDGNLAYTMLTPNVPAGDEASPEGRYRSPVELPNGKVLVSWAEGPVNEVSEVVRTPPDYGLYVFDANRGTRELVQNYEDSWELYAKPVAVRPEPANLESRLINIKPSEGVKLGSINVRRTSLSSKHHETVSGAQFDGTSLDDALAQAVKVRVIEGFSSEAAKQSMFGLTMAEGAAMLGEADVQSDGSWLAGIPPDVPVHLQPIDEFDLSIRSQTTWIQGLPGEGRLCGGCHEDRSAANPPAAQMMTIAASKPAQNFHVPVAERTEYPWSEASGNANEIQALLTAKCASCHNETKNGNVAQEFYTVTMTSTVDATSTAYQIPRLDLTDRPITVTYDRGTHTWPASYVSLFYPAALQMEMNEPGKTTMVTGNVPPKWAVPSDARNSVLIEKLNVASSKEATRYAWPLGEAFSDPSVQGGTRSDHAAFAKLTRDELVKLIRTIDMGGQYYARQNTGFMPFASDPLESTKNY